MCSVWINPRAASATRALLRLIPCHRAYRRPSLWRDFGYSRLPWIDGRLSSLNFELIFPRSVRISRATRAQCICCFNLSNWLRPDSGDNFFIEWVLFRILLQILWPSWLLTLRQFNYIPILIEITASDLHRLRTTLFLASITGFSMTSSLSSPPIW